MAEYNQGGDILKKEEPPDHRAGWVPRWEIALAILSTGVIYFFLPPHVRIGPNWLLLAIEVVILLPIWLRWSFGRPLSYVTVRRLSLLTLTIITIALASGVLLLVLTLPRRNSGFSLFQSAGLLWILNILVFAFWYWEIDGGGPRKRHEANYQARDLMFPQQSQDNAAGGKVWMPLFVDYLFVAFTAATAFSPTDTAPLSRIAKLLMMLEGLLSLTMVAILVARAVNIL